MYRQRFAVIYRTYSGENTKGRPAWYSKRRCLESLLQALDAVGGADEIYVLCDSPGFAEGVGPLIEQLRSYADRVEVEHLPQVRNAGSLRRAIRIGRAMDPNTLVYVSEDDYLLRTEALVRLREASEAMADADYFALYDHPDRYVRTDDRARSVRRPVRLVNNYYWRVSESSCMSFACRADVLKSDFLAHEFYFRAYPWNHDRKLWRWLQSPTRLTKRRMLVSPLPSLATHADLKFLAPVVDWDLVAAEVAVPARQGSE